MLTNEQTPALPWTLSAPSRAALRQRARQLCDFVASHNPRPADVGLSLATATTGGEHRAVIVGRTAEEFIAGLEALAEGGTATHVVQGTATEWRPGGTAFVFSGQGGQWAGMAKELSADSPLFRKTLEECARVLAPYLDWSLLDVLDEVPGAPGFDQTEVIQPVLFAVMVALAELWRAHGIEPDAVAGHSLGEVSAAAVVGGLSLTDAARVSVAWCKEQIQLNGRGLMAALSLSADRTEQRLEGRGDRLCIAAINGPQSVVVSGEPEAVVELVAELRAERIRALRIGVDLAAHSPQVDEMREGMLSRLDGLSPSSSQTPFYSGVTGGRKDTAGVGPEYWFLNLRETVRFEQVVNELLADGHHTFVEIGPHPVLTMPMQEILEHAGGGGAVVDTLRRDRGGMDRFLLSLAQLYVRGAAPDWTEPFARTDAEPIELPEFHAEEEDTRERSGTSGATGWRDRLDSLSEPETHHTLLALVREEAAELLGLGGPDAISADQPWINLGIDSLIAVALRNRLNDLCGILLPVTVAFECPTPTALAAAVHNVLLGRSYDDSDEASDEESETAFRQPADSNEPIAIVGMACRFPGGVASPDDLWRLVTDERDALSPFPGNRGWNLEGDYSPHPGTSGRYYQREGGFLHDADEFDASFFGISPREALAMDPQQRLLLETSWEAIERTGIDPTSLKGSRTGVYVGMIAFGAGDLMRRPPEGLGGYVATGTTGSMASGRIAYTLGLEGPAMTVDTACSSSLTALHTACQALRGGDCELALSAGATVLPDLSLFTEFSQLGALAPDGRDKAFSSAADGFGLAEGVGVLVLERLSDAVRNGHEVLAVVRGSAVNQDGASNGLTAPSGPAQRRVIRQALASAGLSPTEVDAVEAHGTGTPLGDPIEAQALLVTYGKDRPEDRPLWLGSIKSNIGHTQAASGMAGVIKMVEALRHGVLPATLHVDEPTEQVDWSAGEVRLLTGPVAWPESDRPRRAGVSAFGISGTNAHVILEQAPERDREQESGVRESGPLPVVWPVSGRSEGALRGQAARLSGWVESDGGLDPVDVGLSLAVGRSVFEHRVVVSGRDRAELLAGLAAVECGGSAAGVVRGVAGSGACAVLFSGQGAQRLGMGRELCEAFPVFAGAWDAVCEVLDPLLEAPLRSVVWASGADEGLLDRTVWAQAGLFAFEVALYRLVESWGVVPGFLVGHSVGEVAAAYVAGVLSLADACRVVAARGRLMDALPGGGVMVAVEASEAEVVPHLTEGAGIAALNAPGSVVVSGEADAVGAVAEHFASLGRRTRSLPVSHAFHSVLMEPMLDDFRKALEDVSFRPARMAVVSTLTGRPAGAEFSTPEYWVRQVREAVRFADAVEWLAGEGVSAFLELGPDAALSPMVERCLSGEGAGVVVPLLRKDRGAEPVQFVEALALAQVSGVSVRWAELYAGSGARQVALPTYAFERERYWLSDDAGMGRPSAPAVTGSDVRYRAVWRPADVRSGTAPSGRWLAVIPAGSIEQDDIHGVLEGLAVVGVEVVPVEVHVGAFGRADLAGQLRGCADGVAGVVSLLALGDGEGSAPSADASTVVQALGDAGVEAPLWCVTRGAVSVGGVDRVASVAQAGVWGLGRVVALEQPGRWGGVVDLPETVDAAAVERLTAVLAGGAAGEDQVAVRAAGVFVRRMVPAPVASSSAGAAEWSWRSGGTVLVTGGTGGLGAEVARWLASEGVEHLLLVSRRGPQAPGAVALWSELEHLGCDVSIVAADVSDRSALAEALAGIPEKFPLRGVVHTAGVLDDGVIEALSPERFAGVWAAKVDAAVHLDDLTAELAEPLSLFVAFSSVSGSWGSEGQGNYAAANAALEALVERRRARGLVGSCVAWGPWAGAGMAAGEVLADRLRRMGAEPMDPVAALRVLGQVAAEDEGLLTVLEVDWERFLAAFTVGRPSLLFDEIPQVQAARRVESAVGTVASAGTASIGSRLSGLSEEDQRRLLLGLVREQAALVLGHTSGDAIVPGRPFKDLGFDSLTAVQFRNRVNVVTGLTLPPSLVFDYPTPDALAGYLWTEAAGISEVVDRVQPPAVPLTDDPVVIVGMACHFPGGVASPEQLWELLAAGTDAVSEFPEDRGWDLEGLFDPDPEHLGTSYTRHGAFLADAAGFDAGFFGISPREALAMDPQQRLLLETCWEALEDAGIDPASLRGGRGGVFMGTNGQDYAGLLESTSDTDEGYVGLGTAASVMSGRIAYTLGLEGPAVTVDTACSSSLVSLHLAVQALRSGECDLALAGGVTVMSTPGTFVEFSRQRGLAADGRCKAFASGADGTGWGEGAGVLLVERLSDAERLGHRVLAVVRGSAVNQDGASNGLTAPNGPSQQRVIRQALASAGLAAAEVDAVEAHGTGTRLGDPIEAQALLAAYGKDRSEDRPLWLGSIKSNIGHTQAAAGVAGVIKMVEAMRHGVLPATLHAEERTDQVDWSSGSVELLTQAREWPVNEHPRRAGVSAFGVSGTNAHVILEQAPGRGDAVLVETAGPVAWVVSGRNEAALREQAVRLGHRVEADTQLPLAGAGLSLAVGRSVFEHRAVVVGADRAELVAGLAAVAAGAEAPGVVRGIAGVEVPVTAVLFSGQGAQRLGMGRELCEAFPVFAGAWDAVCEVLDPLLEAPLRSVVWASGADEGLLDRTVWAQAGLFAFEVASFRLVESWGVTPGFLVGHSVGEVAAAYVAGVLSLADACRVVAARGRLMDALPGGGVMVAVEASEAEVVPHLTEGAGIAALNAPGSVVVSGEADAVRVVAEYFASLGRRTRSLPVSHAFHSVLMEPMLDDFRRVLAEISFEPARMAVVSTLTGRPAGAEFSTPEYWVRQVREAVRFADAVEWLAGEGVSAFLELGPDAALSPMAANCLPAGGPVVVSLQRRGQYEAVTALRALAELFTHGLPVDWANTLPAGPACRVPLPTYAFQRERYWPAPVPGVKGNAVGLGLTDAGHPLLGVVVESADDERILFSGRISVAAQPWLGDHVVGGAVLVPGTAFVEMAVRAGDQVGCGRVEELVVQAPLVLPERGSVRVQVVLERASDEDSGRWDVRVFSLREDAPEGRPWTRHVIGVLTGNDIADVEAPEFGDLAGTWPPAEAEAVPLDEFYGQLAATGYEYGPALRGLRSAWRLGDRVFAEVGPAADNGDGRGDGRLADPDRFGIHPALFDACLHAQLIPGRRADTELRLPFSWSGVTLHAVGAGTLRVRVEPRGENAVALALADDLGRPVLTVDSLATRPVLPVDLADANASAGSAGSGAESLFRVDWVPVPATAADSTGAGGWAVLGASVEASEALRSAGIQNVSTYADLAELDASVKGGGIPTPAVVVAPAPAADEDPAGPGTVRAGVSKTVELLQEWLADELWPETQLVVLTRNAVADGLDDGAPDVTQAAVGGLVRSAQSEHPGRFVLVDVDGQRTSWETLPRAVACGEPQVTIRQGTVFAPRLAGVDAPGGALIPPTGHSAWRLEATGQALQGLALAPAPDATALLADGQIRIGVRAAGLNFRDVLLGLGMYPGKGSMGSEGAGVVTEVGPGVTDLLPGDRVMGLLQGGFGPLAVVDRRMVAKMPDAWSYEQAASVSLVFLTAYYGLFDLGGLRAGESVLVHSAAGGVGMAAVQIARHVGADVYGTASEGKWHVLRSLGLDDEHIASSRDLGFEEKFSRATEGRGVDVVLDALAREFVDASLRLLAGGGRFLEMGKTDVRDPEAVAAANPGVSYQAFDLSEAGPDRIQEMLLALLDLFEQGALEPLPVRVWDVRRAEEAYRHVSQARHIGKVVLRMPRGLPTDGTVWVTGGTGQLGAMVARRLVIEHGVRSLLLTSRQGMASAGADTLVAELEAWGARVRVTACDGADRAAVDLALRAVPQEWPLVGLVHAAGVNGDGVVEALTPERVDSAMRPKTDALLHLEEATAGLDLSLFLVFSSLAGVLGTAGQGGYAAANSGLDAIVARRRARGLAGVSVAWGLWESASGISGHLQERDRSRLARDGWRPLTDAEGMDLFDRAMDSPDALLAAAGLELAGLRNRAATGVEPTALLRGLVQGPARKKAASARTAADADGARTWRDRLAALDESERRRAVLDSVREQTALVLGHRSAAAVDPEQIFQDMGFDSLTAVEFRNRLAGVSGLRLPPTIIFDYPTPRSLADHLYAELGLEEIPGSGPSGSVLDELDRLEAAMAGFGQYGHNGQDADETESVRARLRVLLDRLDEGVGAPSAPAPAESGDILEKIRSATAAEVFELIDQGFRSDRDAQ